MIKTKISEIVEPTSEIVNEVKSSYNRLLKRQQEAGKYLDSPETPLDEKEKYTIMFKIEIIDVMATYIDILKDWGIAVTDAEMLGGFHIE